MSQALPNLTVEQYEQYNPVAKLTVSGREIWYATPNRACLWRAQTLLTKEPSTIEWLDSLPEGSVLLDVGANVGMYAIYAAVMRHARVFAFEPESQNYAILCRNILLNQASERIVAWPCALSDEERFDRIYLSGFKGGGSCHTFGEQRDAFLKERSFPYEQGSYATTIDDLVRRGTIEAPSHIKIDVDGIEHKVIGGAAQTLAGNTLRSLLVEINPALAEHRWIIDRLGEHGFSYDPAQVARARRTEGRFEGLGEYVFRR